MSQLEKVPDLVANWKREANKLSDEFLDAGYFRLFRDSKVPEKDKSFYHLFSLNTSNRDDVLEEIEKYQDFYEELSNVHLLSNLDNEEGNLLAVILDLKEKLSDMYKAAKLGKNETNSTAICDLHKSFIEKHERLENMIMRVECVALREELKNTKDRWQKAIQSIENLEAQLSSVVDNYEKMNDRYQKLMVMNEKLLQDREISRENDKKMEEMIKKMEQKEEIFLQKNAAINLLLETKGKYEKTAAELICSM